VFDAYDGQLQVRVSANNLQGAPGESSVGLPITRQRWVFDSGGGIKGSPAVGPSQAVYFATIGAGGSVFAVNPDGTLAREWAGFGSVEASPAVGVSPDELVYVAGADAGVNAFLYALSGVDGGVVMKWGATDTTPLNASFEGAVGLGTTAAGAPSADYETAIALADYMNGHIVGLRPKADLPLQPSGPSTGAGVPTPVTEMAFVGLNVFYAESNGELRSLSHVGGNFTANSAWSGPGRALVGGGGQAVAGPAFDGLRAIGAVQSRAIAAVDSVDGGLTNAFPASGATAAPGIPVVGATNVYAGMTLVGGPVLLKGNAGVPGGDVVTMQTSAQISAAPVLGDGDWIYTADSAGLLQAWQQSDFTPHWSKQLEGTVSASPNLACGSAAGHPGTLYVATEAGKLYSIVVDSHGLDSSAPWPKYQHDARNTGNPATMLSCP
jgi:hypothetical protein